MGLNWLNRYDRTVYFFPPYTSGVKYAPETLNKSHDRENVPKHWAERQLSVDVYIFTQLNMIAKTNGGIGRVRQGLVKFLGIS